MGEVVDENVFGLVRSLCDSIRARQGSREVKKEPPPLQLTSPISYDKTLAELLEMGYDIDLAVRAIQECGSLDVSVIIDTLNNPTPSVPPFDLETSNTDLKMIITSLPIQVKGKEEECCVSPDVNRTRYSQKSFSEASTSTARASSSFQCRDEVDEQKESLRLRKSCSSCSEPVNVILEGKSPLDEDGDDMVDSERWECDDPEIGTENSLLRMGFAEEDVTDALQACGEQSDVTRLANYIMNKIVDLPTRDYSSDEEDWGPEDLKGSKEVFRVHREVRVELTDQERSVFNQLSGIGLPFSPKMVSNAVKACGKDATVDEVVDYLLDSEKPKLAGVGTSDDEAELQNLTKVGQLQQLGCYSIAACRRAVDNNCDAGIVELLDYLEAEKIEDKLRLEDEQLWREDGEGDDDILNLCTAKRRKTGPVSKILKRKDKLLDYNELYEVAPQKTRNMKGFGLPGELVTPRKLSDDICGPPFFYFENVASMPNNEWDNIKSFLFDIPPEYVDSMHFTVCRRPRGYIHNLPVEGRADILPKPPMSIQELIPNSAQYWPEWDPRVKLNTINTRLATEFVNRQIKDPLAALKNGEELSGVQKKEILYWAKKWNLVWIRPGQLAPLAPEEVERCLGFDPDHTRVLYSPVDRIRVLGNTFQVNTVAYHLSVLRPMYPNGIRVLSLFTGIGGAEVALDKLGIPLKVVVSIEIEEKSRMVVDSWWKATDQKGKLIHFVNDVKDLDTKSIHKLIDEFGGFDLIVGGSPCNNLSGNNRCTRVGLQGPVSIAFYEFPRILKEVRRYMSASRPQSQLQWRR